MTIHTDAFSQEQWHALNELVHSEASQQASHAINSGDQLEFLLSNGWSEAMIAEQLGVRT